MPDTATALADNSDQIDRSTAFEQAVEDQRLALAAFVRGNPGPFWATYSHADDITVFGGFGGWNKGWHEFEQRTRWSSSQYRDGTGEPRIIASGHSGDLGYTVHLEHITAPTGPSATAIDKTYRVTHIFRWEDQQWKLIHRHADAVIDTQPPT